MVINKSKCKKVRVNKILGKSKKLIITNNKIILWNRKKDRKHRS